MSRPLRIGHLYPESMNIYGDIGNVRALERRARWRGIDVEVLAIGPGPADLRGCDLLFMGGGQDRDQSRIFADFARTKRETLASAIAEGAAVLAVCGGYQLLGHAYVDADGNELEGLGLLDLRSGAGDDRWIGNVLVEAAPQLGLEPRFIVGFENHGGRTQLGPGLQPLGRVVVGGGNNGSDGGDPIGQQRSQDPAVQLGVGDVPVDVEDRGEGAPPAVLEDIAPPWVGRRVGGHMVGHDVEEQRHALAAQRGD